MDPKPAPGLRCLVLCRSCGRQYDATGFAAQSQFRCACGQVVGVPRFAAQDAAVVRCSACGGARERGAVSCAHCGADFTAHESDMQTLCPACMARISDRSRFCHHCGTPIAPQGDAGRPTRRTCPVCGPRHALNGRAIGEPPTSVLECPRCAGLWLGPAAFEHLADRAREATLPELAASPSTDAPRSTQAAGRSLYRPCPECGELMNRRNYARQSGIVLDTCKAHGIWFDAEELGAVLRFVREGGEARAADGERMERRHAERLERIKLQREDRAAGSGQAGELEAGAGSDLVSVLLGALFGKS